jgi:hypothetical protein
LEANFFYQTIQEAEGIWKWLVLCMVCSVDFSIAPENTTNWSDFYLNTKFQSD